MNANLLSTANGSPIQSMAERPQLVWGAPTAAERGPVIATLSNPDHRNAVGSHAGGYSVYRALAIAARTDAIVPTPMHIFDLIDRSRMAGVEEVHGGHRVHDARGRHVGRRHHGIRRCHTRVVPISRAARSREQDSVVSRRRDRQRTARRQGQDRSLACPKVARCMSGPKAQGQRRDRPVMARAGKSRRSPMPISCWDASVRTIS